MRRINVKRVAGVVAIHAEGRPQHGAVDTDRVHGGHHLVAGNLRRTVEDAGPGASRVVAFVGVNLGIQCRHDLPSPEPMSFRTLRCVLPRFKAALKAWPKMKVCHLHQKSGSSASGIWRCTSDAFAANLQENLAFGLKYCPAPRGPELLLKAHDRHPTHRRLDGSTRGPLRIGKRGIMRCKESNSKIIKVANKQPLSYARGRSLTKFIAELALYQTIASIGSRLSVAERLGIAAVRNVRFRQADDVLVAPRMIRGPTGG